MARKLAATLNTSGPKHRDDRSFNPFLETQKIIGFAEEAGRRGRETFTVHVEDGILVWSEFRLPQKHPGFIAIIDRTKFAAGLTSKQWRKLEEKIAIEMCKQRKVW